MNGKEDIETTVIDLPCTTVCGRVLTGDARYYPQVVHDGRLLFFCTETCLDAFRRDPQRFLEVHIPKEAV